MDRQSSDMAFHSMEVPMVEPEMVRQMRELIEVLVGDGEVRIFRGGVEVARHRRAFEPHTCVVDPAHYDGALADGDPR